MLQFVVKHLYIIEFIEPFYTWGGIFTFFTRDPTAFKTLFLSVHSGNMTMRWRGVTMRRMSLFPNADPARAAFAEEVFRSEAENGNGPSPVFHYPQCEEK